MTVAGHRLAAHSLRRLVALGLLALAVWASIDAFVACATARGTLADALFLLLSIPVLLAWCVILREATD